MDFSFLNDLDCAKELLIKKALERKEELLKHAQNKNYLCALNSMESRACLYKNYQGQAIEVGLSHEIDQLKLGRALRKLMPWKKGPFRLFGTFVDGEWRSDFKWNRILPHLGELSDKIVLDIGANNGQFMFRLLPLNPKMVLGIEPMFRPYAQFHLIQSFAREERLHMALWSVEHLQYFKQCFDIVFSLGIIYHHKNPIEQLIDIKYSLKNKGMLILESLGIPGNNPTALFVRERYAGMRNVWFIPTLSCLINWAYRAKFKTVEVVSSTPLSQNEQRSTEWSGPVSLKDFLDPEDNSKTIEGLPAPMRFCLICRT